MKHILTYAVLIAGLVACDPKVDTRGYVDIHKASNDIEIGFYNREDVRTVLGSPSTVSNFGQETWYYITTRKETIAFYEAEVVKQDVIAITYDASGVVSDVIQHDMNDRKDFELVERTTPTEGHELTFIEQLIGNVGRFNKGASGGLNRTGSSRPAGY